MVEGSMTRVIETDETGALLLTPDLLGALQARARYLVETQNGTLVIHQEAADAPGGQGEAEEWIAEWDRLTVAVSAAWKSGKSAVEVVSEMRR
jgi:hypothetical protein